MLRCGRSPPNGLLNSATTPLWATFLLQIVIDVVGYDSWTSVLEHLQLNDSLLGAAETREFLGKVTPTNQAIDRMDWHPTSPHDSA